MNDKGNHHFGVLMSHFLKNIYIYYSQIIQLKSLQLYLTVLVSAALWAAVRASPLQRAAAPSACRAGPGLAAQRPGPGLQGTGSLAVVHGLLLQAMWDLPGPGIEPDSPVLAGGFFTTEISGKTPGKKLKIENVLFSPCKIQTVLK